MSAGQVKSGAVVSRTVTEKLHVAVLPPLSVAVQVTVVVPIGKVLPLAGLHVTVGFGSHASEPLAVKVTAAPLGLVHSATMSAGQVTVGATSSRTVTEKLQVALLPESSVAVHVTVVMPTGKVLPLGGLHVTVGLGSQLSVALALKVTTAPLPPVQSVTMSAGHVTVGGVSSLTVKVTVQVALLPEASVACTRIVCEPGPTTVPGAGV
jgi:hypothetical protein